METKLNIAEILKDKPKRTKLYTDAFGELRIEDICTEDELGITLSSKDNEELLFYNDGKYNRYGEPIIFPSKKMRDWSKFVWKKGDVLVGKNKVHIIFEKFEDDDYISFKGKHYLRKGCGEEDYSKEESKMATSLFEKANADVAQTYINTIEGKLGGKLNLETLEIEKSEFKDGDILCVIDNSDDYHYILIYKGQDKEHIYRYVTMFEDNSLSIRKEARLTKPEDYCTRYATEEEKQQLFDALAKGDKAWNAEKKQIVDLKPKVEFKPFDKVLVRDCLDEMWRPSFFACYLPFGREPYQVIGGEWVKLCIPYEGNESLLGTTKDVLAYPDEFITAYKSVNCVPPIYMSENTPRDEAALSQVKLNAT